MHASSLSNNTIFFFFLLISAMLDDVSEVLKNI
jgi:hypothetical protein